MTQYEIDIILNKPTFEIIIKENRFKRIVESIFIKNGYRWRSLSENKTLPEMDELDQISLHINYYGNEPKILSYSYIDSFNRSEYSIIMNDETYELLCKHFNPTPDYKPRKITREI